MSDAVSFAETDEQHVQLLPERTVMSMFFLADPGNASNGPSGIDATISRVLSVITG